MIHGTTSIKNVISKVIRDLQYNKDFPWQNAVEWGAEALQHIGAYLQFEKKCTKLTVSDYKATLPCDFHMLLQLSYNGKPLTPGSGSFMHLMDSCCFNNTKDPSLDLYEKAAIDSLTQQIDALNAQLQVATDVTVIASLNNSIQQKKDELLMVLNRQSVIGNSDYPSDKKYVYWVNNHHIKLNFREGTIFIAYLGIPVDEDGFPLIPDDISYREALYRYITMKLMYPSYLQGKLRDRQWDEMVQSWHNYCAQARGVANMPDIGQLENIKNMWVRLIPEINNFDSFFNNISTQEQKFGNRNQQSNIW